MSIYAKLRSDITETIKSHEKDILPSLRTLDAEILKEAKDKKKEITDELVIQIAKKSVREKEVSKTYAAKAGRADLIDLANKEIAIVSKYIPKALSLEDTEAAVCGAIASLQVSSKKDMGKVMAYLKEKHGSSLDMGLAGKISGERLV